MPKGHYIRKIKPIEDRFWAAITKTSECWLWTGTVHDQGYGTIQVRRRRENICYHIYAHRFSWELHNGPIPKGLFVCHKCDNPPCTRPDHLFLGTNIENMQDSLRKGRQSNVPGRRHIGESNPSAKLTWATVAEIRASPLSYSQIANKYGVTKACIWSVRSGKSWKLV